MENELIQLTPEQNKKVGYYIKRLRSQGWNRSNIIRHLKEKFNIILIK